MRKWSFLAWALAFGYAILYIPIFTIIAYSFNDSSLASHWDGVSLRWYKQMLEDRQIRESLFLSIRIALVSATFATIFGTCAGLALARLRKFIGRQLFSGMIAAPLVMPEVITGLSLLVLFITMQELIGWPDGRGATTITIAKIHAPNAFQPGDDSGASITL